MKKIRVIKIRKDALFEFIYEKFVEGIEDYFDVDSLSVMSTFNIDWDEKSFVFCVHRSEDKDGEIIGFPKEIDIGRLLKNLPDTTDSMFSDDRYKEYTKEELAEI